MTHSFRRGDRARRFAAQTALAVLLGGMAGACADDSAGGRRVFLIGMDGMDPRILEPMMNQGLMPHFDELRRDGCFSPLQSSIPPQSPVAWSNLISGSDARLHNVFDFMHRRWGTTEDDPDTKIMIPFLSTTEPGESRRSFAVGEWVIPLAGEGYRLLRRGKPFWQYVTAAGIPALVFRMPSQFPPGETKGAPCHLLTGMGTPDMLGGYGQFTLFDSSVDAEERPVPGGRLYRLRWLDTHTAEGMLVGPPNFLRRAADGDEPPAMEIPFRVDRDPEHEVARISLPGQQIVLRAGEWSDWLQVVFETEIPYGALLDALQVPTTAPAICRLLLRRTHPEIELYVSPLNIDPTDPFMPISTPDGWAAEIAEATGLFYTEGIPEDSAGINEGALDDDQYLQQAYVVLDERFNHLDFTLQRFQGGLFYFYFGSTDQQAHVFWRARDPQHPRYTRELGEKYDQVVERTYLEMDRALGIVMEYVGQGDVLMVCSDHGFNSWRRGLNLNTWLMHEGYLHTYDQSARNRLPMFRNVDWSRTRAYAYGINSLYLNLKGREAQGIVDPAWRDQLLDELSRKLKALRDPVTGERAVVEVYRPDLVFPGADPEIAPDLIVGYASGYRATSASAVGATPPALFESNTEAWSGDHCVDRSIVPGIFLANRRLRIEAPALVDIAPTVLAAFGIEKPKQMTGRVMF